MAPELVAQFIPSPSEGVWHLGPIPIRAYALGIICGVLAAIWLGNRRWMARGGTSGEVADVAIWAVPFGLVGARVWHVITDHDLYFGEGRNAWGALQVWHGGLGIWGAIAGGFLGAAIYCKRHHIRILVLADVLAPGLLLAQAIGRLGNYFNQELFGKPTTLPWGLEIDLAHRPVGYEQFATFHPTFLYELLWNLAAIGVLVLLERRFRFGHGRMFAAYVMIYTLGRGWIENLRIDPVELQDVGGLRLNVWTSIVLFLAAAAYFVWSLRAHPGQESSPYTEGRPEEPGEPGTDASADADATTRTTSGGDAQREDS